MGLTRGEGKNILILCICTFLYANLIYVVCLFVFSFVLRMYCIYRFEFYTQIEVRRRFILRISIRTTNLQIFEIAHMPIHKLPKNYPLSMTTSLIT